MKVCRYQTQHSFDPTGRLGILIDDNTIVDPNLVLCLKYQKEGRFNASERANHRLPPSLFNLLNLNDHPIDSLKEALEYFQQFQSAGDLTLQSGQAITLSTESAALLSPMDKIATYRDFYAHEKHVAKGFEKRKEPIPEAWYEIPAYYKGATAGFVGPEAEVPWPHYTKILDYELELAVVIGKEGRDIKTENATKHIFGYTLLNDISARDIQKKEMSIRLGPAKGKDFCSIIGPVITTIDEFDYKEPNLLMTATINGEEWSRGQSADSHYTFAEMIAHASMAEWLLPGDLLGSGTVGTGCGLEIDKWIQPGDTIELFAEHIGTLKNTIGSPN